MKKMLILVALGGACNRGAPETVPSPPQPVAKAETPAPRAESAPGRFGAPLSDREAIQVSALLADPQKYHDQDVKVAGQVGGVCQKKGCWLTLGSGEPGQSSVRVTFQDYGFFVPKDSLGRRAVVEGRFKVTTLSKEEAQHYADDEAKAGAPRKVVDGPQRTLALVATGVELR